MTTYDETNIPLEIDGIDVIENELFAVDALRKGQTIARYEFGYSMQPFLESGQFCKLEPIQSNDTINIGDIVFSAVNEQLNTHMVWFKKLDENDNKYWYLIGTSTGKMIGWTKEILAKAYGMNHKIKENKITLSADALVGISSADALVATSSTSVLGNYVIPSDYIGLSNCISNRE